MLRALALAAAAACFCVPALAGSRLVETGAAPPLPAWVPFCERNAPECAVDPAEPAAIALTPETRELLEAVNRHVNATTTVRTDLDHLGVLDQWNLPIDGVGDCEDLQLLKRRMLVEAGLPRRALRMTVVIDREGAGHAVLTVVTTEGDLVLDNLSPSVLPFAETGHHYVKRESQAAPGWAWIDRPRVAVATAD